MSMGLLDVETNDYYRLSGDAWQVLADTLEKKNLLPVLNELWNGKTIGKKTVSKMFKALKPYRKTILSHVTEFISVKKSVCKYCGRLMGQHECHGCGNPIHETKTEAGTHEETIYMAELLAFLQHAGDIVLC